MRNGDIMTKYKLLIAEDSKIDREIYQGIIPESIYDKIIVTDGEEALKKYQEWSPDIIILDINMPFMNGFQVLKAIREEHNDEKTTIIMVTSRSDKDDIESSAKHGIQGYVIKPFHHIEFNQAIAGYHWANLQIRQAELNLD